MNTPLFPEAEAITQLLAELRRSVKAEGESVNQSAVPALLHELSGVLRRLGPAGRGARTLTRDERRAFAMWELAMAEALGLSRADAHRVVGRVVKARARVGDDVDADLLPRVIDDVADSWQLLSPVERKVAAREIRDASQARMLGFANGFLQNESDQILSGWAALREALIKCLVVRAVEVIPESTSPADAARKVLAPFSEESTHGAVVVVEHHVRRIGKILARVGRGISGRG